MGSIANDAIGGFNTFLKEQKKITGKANITVVLFDHEYLLLHDNVNIKDVPELNNETYVPRGMTALNDAIGRTLSTVGERLKNTNEKDRPSNVIVAILTDGYENNSKEFQANKIKEMIKHQEKKYAWNFIYLAANQDAFEIGLTYGFNKNNSLNFCGSEIGTRHAYANLSNYVGTVRTCGSAKTFKALSEDQISVDDDGHTVISNGGKDDSEKK